MEMKNKKILVYGLGISGVSTIKTLSKTGGEIIVVDSKREDELETYINQIKDIDYIGNFGTIDIKLEGVDLVVKSPGIPPSNELIVRAKENNIEVITDLELGFLLSKSKNIIGITGTNGKTSTTTLVGEILKNAGMNTFVCGNIGIGILDTVAKADYDDAIVIECSSFQLEDTVKFSPKVGVVINITPDHLNWHETYENYKKAKLKVYENQNENQYSIINYEDEYLREYSAKLKSKKIYFSTKRELESGLFLKDGHIIYRENEKNNIVVESENLDIFLENALSAIAIGIAMGVEVEVIKKTLKEFRALPHRMELVDEIDGVKYINDSKGTNPDSTIKAIENLDKDIILIAGGYDKGSNFEELMEFGKGKIKSLILLGETKNEIKKIALENNYEKIYLVENMEEAVIKSKELASKNDTVLLSPACASWGMYQNFEERGEHFKTIVKKIKVAKNEKN